MSIAFLDFFWLLCTTCGILVLLPGIEPVPPAGEAWSTNHWATAFLNKHCITVLELQNYCDCCMENACVATPSPVSPVINFSL